MTSERLGRAALGLDAIYCVGAGTTAVLARRRLGSALGFDPALVAVAGAATVVWSGGVAAAARRQRWRQYVAAVAVANVVAATALGVGATTRPSRSGRALLSAVAVEVAGFAAVQTRSLRRG